MPRPKQIVKRATVEVAKRRRTCKFSNEPIAKGELCLVVHEDSRDKYCYSISVAREMIEMAKKRIEEIELELGLAESE